MLESDSEHTLRISSVPNKVRKMLESMALTEPIDLRPVTVTHTTDRSTARDRGRTARMNTDIALE